MTDDLARLYDAIAPHVFHTHVRWAQFKELYTVSDERIRALDRAARGFFGIVYRVLLDDAFIGLSRLTDKAEMWGQKNLSLVRVVELIEQTEEQTFASKARGTLDQLLKRVEKIRKWRDKWGVHTDLDMALDFKPERLGRVKRDDIDEALRLCRELMGLVGDHLGSGYIAFEAGVVVGSAERLAKLLERHDAEQIELDRKRVEAFRQGKPLD